MSWTQGFQQREDLPEFFREWADSKAPEGSQCECITWDTQDKDVVGLHFYSKDTKTYVDMKLFKFKNKPKGLEYQGE